MYCYGMFGAFQSENPGDMSEDLQCTIGLSSFHLRQVPKTFEPYMLTHANMLVKVVLVNVHSDPKLELLKIIWFIQNGKFLHDTVPTC